MPEFSSYPAGTPSWVDLSSPDPDASARFYGELLGWDFTEPGPVEETGGYRMALLRGKLVAGLARAQSEAQPPTWTTYFATDDADATVARVKSAGGSVFMEPMDVMQAGRMAIVADPTNAIFGLWQAGEHRGAQIANEAGALAWNELATRNMAQAKAFYAAVFGLESETSQFGPMDYTEFKLGDRTVGGGYEMGADFPAQMPASWATYFAVEDCDAAVARTGELGGATAMEPMDIPAGRFAHLRDPQGAAFAVIALAGT